MYYYHPELLTVYENRLEAVKNLPNSRFYFHDDQFAKIDWTIEPSQSLAELYKQRAEQIREQYEYVIIAYSGGVDSTNVLETFYYNNIHIDEILTVGALSQDKDSTDDSNHNGELYFNVFPTLKQLNLPHTKITVEDYSKQFFDIENFSAIKKFQSDWMRHGGVFTSPHTLWWGDLKHFIGKDNDKKTAVVFGADKPIVVWDRYYFKYMTYFADSSFLDYGSFNKTDNFERVNFYISPDTADLMRKQRHVVARFMSLNDKEFDIEEEHVKTYYDTICKLVYDLKHPLRFQSTKSPQTFLSVRDRFILNHKNSEIFKIWNDSLKRTNQPRTKIDIRTRNYYLS